MKRILVIRGGAIGDFVLTLPAIKLLREAWPEARLEILGYKHIIALAENRFYADATRSIEYGPLASFFANGADLPTELANYFASFDLIISYLFDPDRVFEHNVRRCGVELFLAGAPKATGCEHAAVQLARPLEELGLVLKTRAAELHPSAADRELAHSLIESLREPLVAIHPGSGSESKNWPVGRWQALARSLLESADAGSIFVLGGEADEGALRSFRAEPSEGAIAFAENLPLPVLAAALQSCALFLGHDSGISHIAAAVATPCLLLFGPTDPDVWAPQNPGVRILRARSQSIAHLPVEEVAETVRLLSPHTRARKFPARSPSCHPEPRGR